MFILKFFLVFLLPLSLFLPHTEGKSQYVQPLNMGMQVAISYDIANIFSRPVKFGIVSAFVSTACLLAILFFGVITSPFGYFFGVPSQKYVLGDSWQNLSGIGKKNKTAARRTEQRGQEYDWEYSSRELKDIPNFQNIFSWAPKTLEDPECRKMILCSAHSNLGNFPASALKMYRFFSKKLIGMESSHRRAILKGIQNSDLNSCQEIYSSCRDTAFEILAKSLLQMMPKWSRKKGPSRHF